MMAQANTARRRKRRVNAKWIALSTKSAHKSQWLGTREKLESEIVRLNETERQAALKKYYARRKEQK